MSRNRRSENWLHIVRNAGFTCAGTVASHVPEYADLGWFDQAGGNPRLLQHVLVIKLQTIKIEFDCGPRVALQQLAEVARQLIQGECADVMIKILTDAANSARVGIDGFGL